MSNWKAFRGEVEEFKIFKTTKKENRKRFFALNEGGKIFIKNENIMFSEVEGRRRENLHKIFMLPA
jgi:hypothetical protein